MGFFWCAVLKVGYVSFLRLLVSDILLAVLWYGIHSLQVARAAAFAIGLTYGSIKIAFLRVFIVKVYG